MSRRCRCFDGFRSRSKIVAERFSVSDATGQPTDSLRFRTLPTNQGTHIRILSACSTTERSWSVHHNAHYAPSSRLRDSDPASGTTITRPRSSAVASHNCLPFSSPLHPSPPSHPPLSRPPPPPTSSSFTQSTRRVTATDCSLVLQAFLWHLKRPLVTAALPSFAAVKNCPSCPQQVRQGVCISEILPKEIRRS